MGGPQYSTKQFIAARAAVAVVGSVLLALVVWTRPGITWYAALAGAAVLTVLALTFYEGGSQLAAMLFARISPPLAAAPPPAADGTDFAAALLESPLSDVVSTAAVPAVSEAPRRFRFRDSVFFFAWWFGAESIAWVVAGVVAGVRAGAGAPQSVMASELLRVAPMAAPLSLGLGALALVFALQSLHRRYSNDDLSAHFGFNLGHRRAVLLSAAAGFMLGIVFVVASVWLPDRPSTDLGPITQMAMNPGAGRAAFAVAALLAGPVEEVMFRGILLRGFTAVARVPVAALGAGFVFWLMHAPEFGHYWPAAVAIAALTTLVTMLRLRCNSVAPGIAAHVSYNLVIVLTTYASGM